MRTSSTNSIMIGIALCDLAVLSENVYERVNSYWLKPSDGPCINSRTYWYQFFLLVGDFMRETCEKTSFWLGVFLALVRLLIMKLPGNSKNLGRPVLGYLLILVILALSSVHSLYYYSGYRIIAWSGGWKPGKKCPDFPQNYSEPMFLRSFVENRDISEVTHTYVFINGMSRILVSILYPILALLLILVIRKSAKFASESLSKRSADERNRTGRMILVMTIFYVIASAPGGASDFITLFVAIQSNSILETLVGYGSIFISALFCFNAASHGVINFVMSSKYRGTVKMVLGLTGKDGRVLSVTRVVDFWVLPLGDPCVNRDPYWFILFLMIGDFLRESFERSSFWIGVFLALLRVLIMKLDWSSLSKPVVGFLVLSVIVSINSVFSGYFHLIYTSIWNVWTWAPGTSCKDFPANYTEPGYTRQFKNHSFVWVYTTICGASGILISIIYPILAAFLLLEVHKSTKFAKRSNMNKKVSMERHRSGKMILVMTIFYVIASAPRGVMDSTIMFIKIGAGSILEMIIGYGSIFSLVLFCLNSCTHSVINFAMSSSYRATVRMILGREKNVKIAPIS
ncbi:CBN-SRW-79 protein [Caenorhabditis brenneri]|uniref:CBN-SRW-79 protein n=1 Tax=Caenorhabditis brenneri TaxID=135651 RepID=G0M9R9_CAEBE|nr:CBN-SRW-79 protein [Caenorhabditis brenneri]